MTTEQFVLSLALGVALVLIYSLFTIYAKRLLLWRTEMLRRQPPWAIFPFRVLSLGRDPFAVTPDMVLMSRLFGSLGILVGLFIVFGTIVAEHSGGTVDLHDLFQNTSAPPRDTSPPQPARNMLRTSAPNSVRTSR